MVVTVENGEHFERLRLPSLEEEDDEEEEEGEGEEEDTDRVQNLDSEGDTMRAQEQVSFK